MRRKGRTIIPAIADFSAAVVINGLTALLAALPRETAIRQSIALARNLGPRLPRSRIGRENLRRAFPGKSDAQREAILTRMWENFARSFVEYVHLDETFEFDPARPDTGRITVKGVEIFERLRDKGGPAIIFTAHIANWELLGVCAAKFGLDIASLFRPPTNRFLAKSLFQKRSQRMGRLVASRPGVSLELAATLQAGGLIGLLVDQRFHGGVTVPFFGELADTNPLLAKLARQYECPVHGARAVRFPDGRIRLEITEAIDLPRDKDGAIDVVHATAAIQGVVEDWVREFPDQWMWVHRRWRFGRRTRVSAPYANDTATMQTD